MDLVDRLLAADAKVQRHRRARELRASAARLRSVCGSCCFWMKRSCPKEHNVNGFSRGPSMNTKACQIFEMNQFSRELADDRDAEAATLEENRG